MRRNGDTLSTVCHSSARGPSPGVRARTAPGFTLIELLVVIAIVLILIGLLSAGLSGARESARKVICLSNQRQIGIAMQNYANEWDGYVPREGSVIQGNPRERVGWPSALRPYLDSRVPDDADLEDRFVSAEYYRCPSRTPDLHNIHYVSNGLAFVLEKNNPRPEVDRRALSEKFRRGFSKLSATPFADQVIYLAEFKEDPDNRTWNEWDMSWDFDTTEHIDIGIGQFYDVWYPNQLFEFSPALRIDPRRHTKQSNALFLDGHAETKDAAFFLDIQNWDDKIYERVERN